MAPKSKKISKDIKQEQQKQLSEEELKKWNQLSEKAQKKNEEYFERQKTEYRNARDLSDDTSHNDDLGEIRSKKSLGSNISKARDDEFIKAFKDFIAKYYSEDSEFKKMVSEKGDKFIEKNERGDIQYDEKMNPKYTEANVFGNMYGTLLMSSDILRNQFSRKVRVNSKMFDASLLAETLDIMIEKMDETMTLEGSDDSFFMDYYCDLVDMSALMHEYADGKLYVPSENETTLDGKKIHRVSNVTFEDENGKRIAIGAYQPDHEVTKDTTNDKFKNEQLGNISEVDIEGSIFKHNPCMEDIEQSAIGNCYLVAALGSIASKDPDMIRDMITDNNDGSATVRFYTDNLEPVYVTVDKTLPHDDSKDNYVFSGGSNWCGIITKAYALSGLHCGKLKQAEAGTYHGSFGDIEGGSIEDVFTRLLGVPMDLKANRHKYVNLDEFSSKNPSEKEIDDIFDMIDKAEKSDCIMECSTPDLEENETTSDINRLGLPQRHAYSVVGTEIDKSTNKKYIRVWNPHADKIRSYDKDGNPIEVKFEGLKDINARPGESLIEIHDFCNVFYGLSINKYDYTLSQRVHAKDLDDFKNIYEKAIVSICDGIEKTDSWLLRVTKKNSPQFTEFKKAALEVRTKFEKSPDLDSIKNSMKDLFGKARAYKEYCDGSAEKNKDIGNRGASRYMASDIVGELEKAVISNNAKSAQERNPIDLKDLINNVMSKDLVGLRKTCRDIKYKEYKDQIKEHDIAKTVVKKGNGISILH